ncbi:MAG: hypothetical protein QCI38_04805, partial [Candidatus Thermoplasmatota archaeon]|nr:hypothetical protein [Candidatus Thermoplasmatota archaeon]
SSTDLNMAKYPLLRAGERPWARFLEMYANPWQTPIIYHTPPADAFEPLENITLNFTVENGVLEALNFYYRNDSEWHNVSVPVNGTEYAVSLPPHPQGSTVEYYFVARDDKQVETRLPACYEPFNPSTPGENFVIYTHPMPPEGDLSILDAGVFLEEDGSIAIAWNVNWTGTSIISCPVNISIVPDDPANASYGLLVTSTELIVSSGSNPFNVSHENPGANATITITLDWNNTIPETNTENNEVTLRYIHQSEDDARDEAGTSNGFFVLSLVAAASMMVLVLVVFGMALYRGKP